ncbi:MAG: glycosyltransferase involved in cell wall biosynthesis [Chlamydiales bacterium]|jgi:glycosyltransferase involved in cell wall biosynthesis
MNSQSPLTLCLIVKNESRFLEKCVRSVDSIVSKIVIVDTGSTDDTLEIARSLTPDVMEVPFKNNFSEARNYALQFVDTPWVLYLDADECFEKKEAEALLQVAQSSPSNISGYRVWRYNFFGNGGWYTSKNLKLFRNDPTIRYEGLVAESVKNSITRYGGEILDAPVVLNHFGHCRSADDRDKKAEYYLRLMKEEVKQDPKNHRILGYIGLIQRTLGKFDEALEAVEKSVSLGSDSSHSYYCQAQVLRSVGKDEEALEAYKKSLEMNPEDPLMWNMIGVMQLSLQLFSEAKASFDKALEIEPILDHVRVNLGLLAQAQEDFVTAKDIFEGVARRNPGFLHEEFFARCERDPFRDFYYESILRYAGLGYHLAYAQSKCKSLVEA